jgi:hypothetical protein
MRHDEHVAAFESQRSVSRRLTPTGALADDVIRNDVLCAGKDDGREVHRRRRFCDPGRSRVDEEEDGAGQPHDLEHVRQRVGRTQ